MNDSSLMTTHGSHIAAVLVGVLVTVSMTVLATGLKSSSAATDKEATGSATSKKKKKRTKKKVGAAQEVAASATDDVEDEKVSETPVHPPQDDSSSSNNNNNTHEKKAKKKKTKATTNGRVSAHNASAEGVAATVETPAEAPPSTAKAAVMPPTHTSSFSMADYEAPRPKQLEETWATIPSTKSKKSKHQNKIVASTSNSSTSALRANPTSVAVSAAPADSPAPTAPEATPTKTSEIVLIDASKVGIIIGPKGATMQAIQAATGCKLDVNAPAKDGPKTSRVTKASVVITNEGTTTDGIAKARQAILELASRGYATLLQSETFGESHIQVHPRQLSEIVGPGGKTIQALQTGLNVKITIPKTDWKPNAPLIGNAPPSCKVGIAADDKANIKQAKLVIQAILKYHHHELTHPGVIHDEVHVPQEFFHCVIGTRGSEIKHIRGNYKVDVYMPTSDQEKALVVGQEENVAKAIGYIHRLMERDSEQRARKYSDELYG
jgi:predicted RNA-binding protein YlqC (UPF0109 family)